MKTAFVVLGMHRSGTSSVAGVLSLLGATAPRTLMKPAADNPTGFWESEVVMRANDTLLAEGGSRWDDARALPRRASTEGADPRLVEALVVEFGEADSIVLKDPRMCRLLPPWLRAFEATGYTPLIISPLRHPMEVAASLAAREPRSPQSGVRLWLRHVLEAEAASRGLPRHLMTWSRFMTDWRSEVALINARLGSPLPSWNDAASAAVDAFLTPDLKHQAASGPPTGLAGETWRALLNLVQHGEHPDIHSRLDQSKRDLDRAFALFSDMT